MLQRSITDGKKSNKVPANRKPYKLFIKSEATVMSTWKYPLKNEETKLTMESKTTECQHQRTS